MGSAEQKRENKKIIAVASRPRIMGLPVAIPIPSMAGTVRLMVDAEAPETQIN